MHDGRDIFVIMHMFLAYAWHSNTWIVFRVQIFISAQCVNAYQNV